MHVSHGLRRLSGLCLAVATLGNGLVWSQQPASGVGTAPKGELRWTPHRAATASAQTETRAAVAETAPISKPNDGAGTRPDKQPSSMSADGTAVPPTPQLAAAVAVKPTPATVPAPASVGLPAGVPPVTMAPRQTGQQSPSFGQARQRSTGAMGDWKSDNRVPGRFSSSAAGGPQLKLPNLGEMNLFRAPQGESGRPVLAVEGTSRRPSATATRTALGGGLAPRFNPSANTSASGRPERLAMNADGLPSVMARAPQPSAVDDAFVPGRLPADGGPTQALPPPPAPESASVGVDPSIIINTMPLEMPGMGVDGSDPGVMIERGSGEYADGMTPSADGGMWMGDYPAELHVESFYDDPFACEESPGFLPCWPHDGRICAWLRQFGKPYYGWRWYRDFSAGAGITAFQNQTNFGLLGNYGTNEYLNWAMPFWNAFGVGWQIGARGVQSNFQQPTVSDALGSLRPPSRDQVFVTTGFFTRAFEGRGLQGGAVYDYLSDSYFENVDVAQIRGELSYVWGYHELGFWGAFSTYEQFASFAPTGKSPGMAGTVDLYTAFYRLHFGDANEARIWGGASGNGQGVIGSLIRAPMSRSLALEGTFTYLLPAKSQTVAIDPNTSVTFAPSAWNLSANLVWYPAGRARRGLASPYRPLFDVADNGSMIRSISRLPTP